MDLGKLLGTLLLLCLGWASGTDLNGSLIIDGEHGGDTGVKKYLLCAMDGEEGQESTLTLLTLRSLLFGEERSWPDSDEDGWINSEERRLRWRVSASSGGLLLSTHCPCCK